MLCIAVAPESRRLGKVDMFNAAMFADLVELRLDRLEKDPDLKEMMDGISKPILVSCRRKEDGGAWDGSEEERMTLIRAAIVAGPAYIELEHDIAYGHIYVRDRFRCSSPVCSRRDVTPHHLQFRSAGGSDEDENIGSLCTWCHLLGVHGGRIRARGRAGHIRWELGPVGSPCIVVEGRDRAVACASGTSR